MSYLSRLRDLHRRDRVTGWADLVPGLGWFLFMLRGIADLFKGGRK